MASRLLTLAGLIEALFPGRIVAVAERLAFDDRGEAELRSWIRPATRIEGVLWVLLSRRSTSSLLRVPVGLLGVLIAVAPRRAADLGLKLAYERSETIELASWVVPAARVIGLAYVLIGLRTVLGRGTSAETADESGASAGGASTADTGAQE
ncbi:hypothetical protein C2R22_06550 [Salinigranum rubrum]|uniref:Uncharacterized protein n=1 Tax=Salinigranum rubrum TaxID=755307 RepID=A0A2I8VHE8_9EURY|nr:hypothetical protein [Salinigranum rubrum]AUV81362.1 hypothetical protein C2R22_06550 [Salinigranum rubrum]